MIFSEFYGLYKTDKHALSAINKAFGTRYTYARLKEWERGKRPMPEPIKSFMFGMLLPKILKESGVPDYVPVACEILKRTQTPIIWNNKLAEQQALKIMGGMEI